MPRSPFGQCAYCGSLRTVKAIEDDKLVCATFAMCLARRRTMSTRPKPSYNHGDYAHVNNASVLATWGSYCEDIPTLDMAVETIDPTLSPSEYAAAMVAATL